MEFGKIEPIIFRRLDRNDETSLDVFVRLALPLLSDGGAIIALKGEVDRMELKELRYKALEERNDAGSANRRFTMSLERYGLPLSNSKRSIITIRHKRDD